MADLIRLAIVGSRTVDPGIEVVDRVVEGILRATYSDAPDPMALLSSAIEEVVCGCAGGADSAGSRWADHHGIRVYHEPITEDDIRKYGKYLGPRMRNRRVADRATHAIAFWDGKSGGTPDLVCRMVARQKPVIVAPTLPARRRARRHARKG